MTGVLMGKSSVVAFRCSAPACERGLGVHRSAGLVERTVLWPMALAYLGREQERTRFCRRETDEKQYNLTNSKE